MKINKKLFALLISIILILSSLPVSAFAQGEEGLTETSDLSNAELALIYDEKNYENEYVPGELIIGLNESNEVEIATLEEDIDANIEIAEVEEIETYGVEPVRDTLVITLEDKSEEAVLDAIEELKNNPNIAYVEPNYELDTAAAATNDEYYSALWGMEKIDAPSAWDITTGDSSVMVAVIDSGVNYTHEDLVDNVNESLGYDFVDNRTDAMDVNGHGTFVSGIIGASANNGIGVVGVNWDVTIVPIRAFNSNGRGNKVDILSGIYYATSLDVPIINASYGGDTYVQAEKDAIDAYGGLFVTIPGNQALNVETSPKYPGSYDCDNIISVAATDETDSLWEESSYGAVSVDLGAPGVDILSTWSEDDDPNTYAYGAGTSFAAPHVAGAAALLLSNYKDLTTAELKEALLESVDKVPDLSGKCVTGGRLNVAKALEYAEVFNSDSSDDSDALANVEYRVSTYENGWGEWVSNGEVAGTLGTTINAIQIVTPKNKTFRWDYSFFDSNVSMGIGAGSGATSNAILGNVADNISISGFSLKPSSNITENYDFQVCVCANSEWTDWKSNESISFENIDSGIEAIQVKLVPKEILPEVIEYRVSTYKNGWEEWSSNGEVAGMPGTRINAIQIVTQNNMTFTYRYSYNSITSLGRTGGTASNAIIGDETDYNMCITDFSLKPSSSITENYTLQMRVCANSEWTDWKSNESISFGSFTSGIEAIQIKLVQKSN